MMKLISVNYICEKNRIDKNSMFGIRYIEEGDIGEEAKIKNEEFQKDKKENKKINS